jgi:hypothetical protein
LKLLHCQLERDFDAVICTAFVSEGDEAAEATAKIQKP